MITRHPVRDAILLYKALRKGFHSPDPPAVVEAGMAACRARIRLAIRILGVLSVILTAGLIVYAWLIGGGLAITWGVVHLFG